MRSIVKCLYIYFFLIFVNVIYAQEFGAHRGLGQVSFEASSILNSVARLILYVAIIAGIAFVLTAILKLKQHWKNPQQVPIGNVITLFILGLILIGIPMLINYTQSRTAFNLGFSSYQNINLVSG